MRKTLAPAPENDRRLGEQPGTSRAPASLVSVLATDELTRYQPVSGLVHSTIQPPPAVIDDQLVGAAVSHSLAERLARPAASPAQPALGRPEGGCASFGHRASGAIQFALLVGRDNDPYEQEADRTARRIVDVLRARTRLHDQIDAARADETGSAGGVAGGGRLAETAIGRIRRISTAAGSDGGPLEADIEKRIAAARASGGSTLAPLLRRRLEEAFNADFGAVRLHSDREAGTLSQDLGARAFTLGSDIFLGPAHPDLNGDAGIHLLSHELTHTLQQGGAAPAARTMGAQRAPGPSVVRRGKVKAKGRQVTGVGPADGVEKTLYPKDVVLRGETIRLRKEADLDEAAAIIGNMKIKYGIDLSSQTTIDAIKINYQKVHPAERNKLRATPWEMKELRALHVAAKAYAPLLGEGRSRSSMATKAQGLTTIGKLAAAIDVDTNRGRLDNTTLGETFTGQKNIGIFTALTNSTDDEFYAPGEQDNPSNKTAIEAAAIHEMTHALIEPEMLPTWVATFKYWRTENRSSGTRGMEEPPTEYGESNAGEDLCESVAMFFVNKGRLEQIAPQRARFIRGMVASWTPVSRRQVVKTVVKTSPRCSKPRGRVIQ